MNAHYEIEKIKKHGAALKYAVLSIAAAGIAFGALKYGNDLGYKAGWQDAQIAVEKAIHAADYPTVYLTYPGRFPVEMDRDGICIPDPSPASIPQFYNHVWVSPHYEPCVTQHYTKPTSMSPALAAIMNEVQK